MAKVLGPMICVSKAVLVRLWKEIAITLWSSPLLLKDDNASTGYNEPVFEILIKDSLLLVAILGEFILQATRLPRRLALQKKGSVSVGLRLRNSRGGVVLIMVLLVIITVLVASTAAAATTGTDVDVGDKLPADCEYVLDCSENCLSCSPKRKGFNCCS